MSLKTRLSALENTLGNAPKRILLCKMDDSDSELFHCSIVGPRTWQDVTDVRTPDLPAFVAKMRADIVIKVVYASKARQAVGAA